MPSPFPGMDPYLENPVHWEGFHQILMTALMAALNETLPSAFVARLGERVYVLEPPTIVPDVAVLQRETPRGAAVLDRPRTLEIDRPFLVTAMPQERREVFVDIVSARQPDRIVAAIEVLSPANKTPGRGRRKYQKKQRDILRSGTHLLEIDLLRDGAHTLAVTELDVRRASPRFDYAVSLHQAGAGPDFEVWTATVQDRLPCIYVPLTDDYPEVGLDLQAAVRRSYEAGAFDRSIDYGVRCVPPLNAADSLWADRLLQAAGLHGPVNTA